MPIPYAPYHYDIRQLPTDRNSWVILSKRPVTAAIVFVHGFHGKPLETWKGFDEQAILLNSFQSADLYFFGYDGFLSNTLAAASFLFDLLDGLGRNPGSLLGTLAAGSVAAHRAQGYQRIIVVAHSLGAVVSRWALVRAAEEQSGWRNLVRSLFFAPAHCGSDLARLTSEAVGGFAWLKGLVEGVKAGLPLVRELDHESPVLRDLERRTRDLLPANPHLRAARVVIAEREVVVNNWIFAGDPFPQALRDTDHVTVCKPTQVQPEPLRILEEMLA